MSANRLLYLLTICPRVSQQFSYDIVGQFIREQNNLAGITSQNGYDNLLSMDCADNLPIGFQFKCRSLPVFIVSELFPRIIRREPFDASRSDYVTDLVHNTYWTCEQAPTALKARADVVVSSERSESLRNAAG